MEDNNNLNNEEVNNIVNEVEDTNVNINQQNNNIEQNNENINYSRQSNNSSVPLIIMFIILLLFVFVFLGNSEEFVFNNNSDDKNNIVNNNNNGIDNVKNEEIDKNDSNKNDKEDNEEKVENNSTSDKLSYEIKKEEDPNTNVKWYYLYVNNKKVNNIKAYEELGSIEVKEFNDLLIVDEKNPGSARRLLVVDKNTSSSEMDYQVSTYSNELRNSIDSYKIEGNSLYIKVNRFKDGHLDWYCYFGNKEEIVEYEVKYEYENGKFIKKEIMNELSIKDKYNISICKYIGSNKDNTIKYELLYDNEWPYALYVNNIKTIVSASEKWKIQEFKDIIMVSQTNLGPGGITVSAINKDGEIFNFDYNIKIDNLIQSYKTEDDSIYINVIQSTGNGLFDGYCYVENRDDVARYTIKYDYIGNGKFEFDKTMDEIKFKDAYNYEECTNN